MRLIDADKLSADMYHEAFEIDSDLQKWDSGCWIRYKMFTQCIEKQPTINSMEWTPITTRPMDEEERLEWSEKLGYDIEYEEAVIYEHLPDDGQEVLTCSRYGRIAIDTFENDNDGCYFEENGDMDGIIAWMPLPEPYKAESEDKK